jgi:tetratricopeptide (TPR) repeat protein
MNEDVPESSGFYDFLAWLEVNKKRLIQLAAVLIVIGFAVAVVRYVREQKELNASAELLALRPPLNAGTNAVPIPASSFLNVASQFSGTEASERASLLAAGALFTEGKYAEAQTQFNKFLTDYSNSPWAGEAAYGVASCLEALNKQDEALTAYQNVVNRYGTLAVADEAKQSLARLYEAKKQPEQALKLYDELTRGAAGRNNPELMMKRGQLLKQYPYLDRPLTNASSTITPKLQGAPASVPTRPAAVPVAPKK